MSYKVCILTAGMGSRLDEKTKYFNKSLLKIGNKAAISYIVDHFPDDVVFVVALGYKGSIVRQYLEISHPEKKFEFVYVDNYNQSGSGPGYSMLLCKDNLQCPFVYFSCDSILLDSVANLIDEIDENFIVYDFIHQKDCESFCTVSVEDNKIIQYFNKTKHGTNLAFTGVSFIKDYNQFWEILSKNISTINGEIQNAPAILELKPLSAVKCRWMDVGSKEGLKQTKEYFKGIDNLDKLDEEIYVVNNKVIKYFYDKKIAEERVNRSKILKECIPSIDCIKENFYRYNFIDGVDLFRIENQDKIFNKLLSFSNENMWNKVHKIDNFKDICYDFYYNKTISRLKKLWSETSISDRNERINEINVPCLSSILKEYTSWDYLCDGVPGIFHGDFNFSNIIFTSDENFKFVDWRQNFGKSLEYGDIYYDFAKMYSGFLFPHESVKKNKFFVHNSQNKIKTFIEIPITIEKCKNIFEDFLIKEGYDLKKTKILSGIVLLNMSSLHEYPINEYLYYFGKYFIFKTLKDQYE